LRERNDGVERWVIFDNTAEGQAVPNALDLMEELRVGRRNPTNREVG
jgi:uncharacterized protein YecE (DUF72 family)